MRACDGRQREHGARNVHILFTQSRAVADSDAFVAIIRKARGIWFDGGRQFHDIQAYGGAVTWSGDDAASSRPIPSPCEPSQYTLAQSVTRTRDRINGVTNPTEGQTLDDLAKSGRHFATAPFRQEFLGGGTAPLGYVISMADPPSIGYGPATNAEWDRDFVTSLIGPAGRQSVSWSLSVRIENGVVKRNTLS